ncbi:MAG: hypothetical protein OES46_09440 [Gammaproteobacteria bacterium]|jgi:hypothetical protein|nr:hypothetical protein [Gammaproteobacteria bacterium]
MKSKAQVFFLGLIIGILVAFPLGINLGRDVPLFSNPFAEPEVRGQMADKMKEGAGRAMERTKEGAGKAVEGAKKKLHEVTKPKEQETEQQ